MKCDLLTKKTRCESCEQFRERVLSEQPAPEECAENKDTKPTSSRKLSEQKKTGDGKDTGAQTRSRKRKIKDSGAKEGVEDLSRKVRKRAHSDCDEIKEDSVELSCEDRGATGPGDAAAKSSDEKSSVKDSSSDRHCADCDVVFPSAMDLREHVAKVRAMCCLLRRCILLWKHLRTTVRLRPFRRRCLCCGHWETFHVIYRFQDHSKKASFRCPYCSEGFSKRGQLEKHVIQHASAIPTQALANKKSALLLCH